MVQLSFEEAHKITNDLKAYIGNYIFGQQDLVDEAILLSPIWWSHFNDRSTWFSKKQR